MNDIAIYEIYIRKKSIEKYSLKRKENFFSRQYFIMII